MEIWTYVVYINDVQLFVTLQRKSTKTQFWSDVTKISWTLKSCSYPSASGASHYYNNNSLSFVISQSIS